MNRSMTSTLLVLGLLLLPSISKANGQTADVMALDSLLHWESVDLALVPESQDEVRLPLILEGAPCTLHLTRHNLRSPRLEIRLKGPSENSLSPADLPLPATYRGVVLDERGEPRSERVAASRGRHGEWTGIVLGGETTWVLQPLAMFRADAEPSQHVLYDTRDVVPSTEQCGNDELLDPSAFFSPRTERGAAGGSGGFSGPAGSDGDLYVAEIAFEADFLYYKEMGKDPIAVIQDIESVMNGIDLIYRRDVELAYEITYYLIRTSRHDNYSKAKGLMFEMQEYWNANLPHVARDVAHLMTGHDTQNLGQAWIGTVCDIERCYGYSKTRWTTNYDLRVILTAHELGHNFNGMHCDAQPECRIMCGFINGCSGGDWFTDASKAAITDYRDGQTCFDKMFRDANVPLYDSFENGVVDHPAWSYQRGLQVVHIGAEPNGQWTLELNAEGDGETREDELRSGLLDLTGQVNTYLTFYTRSVAVPAGQELRVDYYDSDLLWKPLHAASSSGTDPAEFEFHRVLLDPIAWPELRLRFVVTTTDPSAKWYLDDVQIRRGGLSHTIDPLIAGQRATFAARGATPFASVHFLYSTTGIRPDSRSNGGLDLLPPISLLGRRTADATGEARLELLLPPSTPPMDYFGQLGAIDGTTLIVSHAVPTEIR